MLIFLCYPTLVKLSLSENNEGNESTNQNNVPKITLLASILAALAHDAAHPGVNNNYLIDISHPLALTYNDRSLDKLCD